MNLGQQWEFLRAHPGFKRAPATVVFRLVVWRMFCSLGKPGSVQLSGPGLRFYLPPLWHGASKLLYVFRDDFEPDLSLMNRFLTPASTMVDVGANYGVFSMVAARLVGPSGKVIGFEPAQSTFSVFQKNLTVNGIANVTPLRMALAEKPGQLRLYHDADPTRNSLAPTGSSEFEEVEVSTLDHVLAEKKVVSVQFLKIDVEGADELVLRGARATLERDKPPVFFEHNSAAASRMGLAGDGSFRVLEGLGYRFYQTKDERLIPVTAATSEEGNILAVHALSPHAEASRLEG